MTPNHSTMEESVFEDKRICVNCGSDKTYIQNGYKRWYNHNGWHCQNCHNKLFLNPKWRPINNKKRMRFKDKVFFLPSNPKKGVCSWCGKKEGEPFINNRNKLRYVKTAMHHIEYHDDDPLKDAIELCASCHGKEGFRLGQLTGIKRYLFQDIPSQLKLVENYQAQPPKPQPKDEELEI